MAGIIWSTSSPAEESRFWQSSGRSVRYAGRPPLWHGHSAVHVKRLPGDVAGLVGGQNRAGHHMLDDGRGGRAMTRIALALAAYVALGSCAPKSERTQIYLQRFWGECGAAYGHSIDVAAAEEDAQDLIFARIVSKLREHLERRDLGVSHVVVFVDELNKYAPNDGYETYVRKMLLDISERGRYLGLVLFSAQQFRSQVHRRVVGNSGTALYGRMDGDGGLGDFDILEST